MTEETYRAIRELFPNENAYTSLFMAENAGLITRKERWDGYEFAGRDAEKEFYRRFNKMKGWDKD